MGSNKFKSPLAKRIEEETKLKNKNIAAPFYADD